MHEDKILLRLKRKYTKDEEVSFILKALADAQFENGVLKSEIAELKANKMVEKRQAEKPKEPAYPETVVNNFIGEIAALKKANANLKQENIELRRRNNLLAKQLQDSLVKNGLLI